MLSFSKSSDFHESRTLNVVWRWVGGWVGGWRCLVGWAGVGVGVGGCVFGWVEVGLGGWVWWEG